MSVEIAPYYSHCNDNKRHSAAGKRARLSELEAWYLLTLEHEPDFGERDWLELAAEVCTDMGVTPLVARNYIGAMMDLNRMPALRAHAFVMGHLSLRQFDVISQQITTMATGMRFTEEVWRLLDDGLTDYLTPRRPSQVMPSSRAIAKKVRDLLAMIRDELGVGMEAEEEDEKPKDPARDYGYCPGPKGTTLVYGVFDEGTSALIDTAVRNHAAATGTTFGKALAELILGNVKVSVSLNAYRAIEDEAAPMNLQPYGFISREAAGVIADYITNRRDMEEAGAAETGAYRATAAIAACVEGRDGTCRWPGCNRPARDSQKDHRIDWAKGGATAARNLVCLCQTHHNRKTDGVVKYWLEPDTGAVYWLFADGTWVVDEAEGPLGERAKHWVRTFIQRRRVRQTV